LLKIDQLFFRNFLAVIFLILALSGVITYVWFKTIYLDQVKTNLSQNIDALALSLESLERIEQITSGFSEKTKLRVTFIDALGNVLAESALEKEDMDNHANRQEIIGAKEGEYGMSIRTSKSTGRAHLYVAKMIQVGDTTLYLRIAEDVATLDEYFLSLSLKILFIFFAAFLVALLLALRLNKTIKSETDNVLDILHRLIDKKQFEVKKYGKLEEFNKITKLLNEVGGKLKSKANQKAKQNAKLKLANRQKDEIISALSHEFKNPIAVITGYCETMLKNNIDEDIKKKFLQKIENSAHKMSDIIDKLRLSIKLEDGKQGLKFETVQLKSLAQTLANDVVQSYKNRDVVVEGQEVQIKVDKVLFSIALSNLIENGLKYSSDVVTVSVFEDRIEVVDKGSGLDKKEIDKITKKFYRVATNTWNNSLGLGLNIVENIIKLHRFHLKISSKKEQGSTFAIYFL
jgi:signal transduction histidine kinase